MVSEIPGSMQPPERLLVLVKALPHVGKKHGEAVCCAGVTPSGEWRRLFPISFRSIESDKRFDRWNWIEYSARIPRNDKRPESRHVQIDTLSVQSKMTSMTEKSRFLDRLLQTTTDEAFNRGQTLALIRPSRVRFNWKEKTEEQLARENTAYQNAASQVSFLEEAPVPFEPPKYSFHFTYFDSSGRERRSTSDDWETSATFYRWRRAMGESEALAAMKKQYEIEYPERGMVFAMGTHSLYPKIWLLVGVIRVDENKHFELL